MNKREKEIYEKGISDGIDNLIGLLEEEYPAFYICNGVVKAFSYTSIRLAAEKVKENKNV